MNNINVSFGDNKILQNINFEVNTRDKVAIVGRNGCGKTTLLKVITGQQDIDLDHKETVNSKIQMSGKVNIGYLKQIAFEDDSELFEREILKAFAPIIDLKNKIDNLERLIEKNATQEKITQYEQLCHQYDILGGYTYLKEYNMAIKKFGFGDEDKHRPLSSFSGGQRTKIALLKLILSKPDLLILDEPTNHLDINSIRWLEEYLANYPKAIVVVSHDRAFLDKFVSVVYEIERNNIKRYVGNYTKFVQLKALNYEKELKEYKLYVDEKARLQAVADRFRYKATKASMAQSKLKQIERMEDIAKPQDIDDKVFSRGLQLDIESDNEVVIADNIAIGYDKVLSQLSFKIYRGDRVGVVGGNGLGKSTLLKSIDGRIQLLGGKLKIGNNVNVGYYDQQTATNNIANESVLDNFLKEFSDYSQQEGRSMLGSFCFTQDEVFKNIRDLSGGERVRLELCKILCKKPNFLILDEPTNHMDIMGKEALESMLQQYKGTIIFVSHDRYFVNKIARDLIVFENGGGRYIKDMSYNEYEKSLEGGSVNNLSTINKANTETSACKEKPNTYLLNKQKSRNEAKKKKIEGKISIVEGEIAQMSNMIESPEICSDYHKIMELQSQIDERNKEIDLLMQEWITLNDN